MWNVTGISPSGPPLGHARPPAPGSPLSRTFDQKGERVGELSLRESFPSETRAEVRGTNTMFSTALSSGDRFSKSVSF